MRTGYTLLELMTVIAIVGIIMTFAIPIYQSNADKANVSRIVNKLGSYKLDMIDTYTATSTWPATINNATAPETVSDAFFPNAVNFRYNNLSNSAWVGYKLDNDYGSGWIFLLIIANSDGSYSVHCGSLTTDCTIGSCNSSSYFPSGCSETNLNSTYSLGE